MIVTTKYIEIMEGHGLDDGCIFHSDEILEIVQTEEFGLVAYVSFHSPLGFIKEFPLHEGEWEEVKI